MGFGRRSLRAFATILAVSLATTTSRAETPKSQAAAWTYHYDNFRTGWNQNETSLTPQKIKSGSFGLLLTVKLDDQTDQVDAQPLVVPNVMVQGKLRQVVYVATENNNLYAIDSYSGKVIKKRHFGNAVPMPDCGNNGPTVGINSTPVVDMASRTLYLVAFSLANNMRSYKLYAVDLATLEDRLPAAEIGASNFGYDGSTISFIAGVSRQRAALTLNNGLIYVAFSSFCDNDWALSRGWVMGWHADDLTPLAENVLNNKKVKTKGQYYLSSVWMSGYGPATDESGNFYFVSGNSDGDREETPGSSGPLSSWPDSVVKVSSNLSKVVDFFTPYDPHSNVPILNADDRELGSGGVMLLPPTGMPGEQRSAVVAGKLGQMFLLDREKLGGYDPNGLNKTFRSYDIGGCWCGPSYFVGSDGIGRIVSSGENSMAVWKVLEGGRQLEKDYVKNFLKPQVVFQKGFFTSISSKGQQSGTAVIWAVQRPIDEMDRSLNLYAFDAKDGSILSSAMGGPWPAGPWPNTGGGANAVPVVANGRVFVASFREVRIYGLGAKPPQQQVAAPVVRSASDSQAYPKRTIYGTIAETQGSSSLWLKTRTTLIPVDTSRAERDKKDAPLTAGQTIVVQGAMNDEGGIEAETIGYVPATPDAWPVDK